MDAANFARTIWTTLGGADSDLAALSFTSDGDLPSAYRVTDLASASIGVAALAIAELIGRPAVVVDRRLSSFWFGMSIRPIGWEMPAPWDPIAGDYSTKDGWIRLHTNAPHHRRAAEGVLGSHAERSGMAAAVAPWA
jgi:hypothetical protein